MLRKIRSRNGRSPRTRSTPGSRATPPRHKGVVVESTIGTFGHIGPMRHVSPTAPWFRVQLGYELFRFLMFFGEADLVIANTSYTNPPPPPRTYALYGFGGGIRGTFK